MAGSSRAYGTTTGIGDSSQASGTSADVGGGKQNLYNQDYTPQQVQSAMQNDYRNPMGFSGNYANSAIAKSKGGGGGGINGPFDWSSIFGPPNQGFNLGGGGYAGQMGMGYGYSPTSHLDFFQNWDNWRRQMISQNYYLPALQMTNFGY